MKTIVSFSLLCALLLAMFLLTPLVKSWGASHPGTLKNASYNFQIEPRKDLPSDIPGPYGASLLYARIAYGKIYLASGYGRGYRHGYPSHSKAYRGRRHIHRYHPKVYRGKSHSYSHRQKGYYGKRDLRRDYYKGYNAGRYGYKPYRRDHYSKGYTYRYPHKKYWYYYGYCY
jgi:hypothetical protein